jgi:hypothetical protein
MSAAHSASIFYKKTMTIITLFQTEFNRVNYIIYGLQSIPPWHHLYHKKCWRVGWYRRKLILFDKTVIEIYVYRFYCLETKKTYSLLPFFINHYERHINTVIEDILLECFDNGVSAERLAEEPTPSPWTIRRWIKKFGSRMDDLRQKVEGFLISNLESYLPAAQKDSSQTFNGLLEKAKLLPIPDKNLHLYGSLSYLFYAAAVQNPQL